MAKRTLTVTQLKWAVLDPEWRERWRAGEAPLTPTPQTPAGGFSVQGQQFHRLARAFTAWLSHGKPRGTIPEPRTEAELWHELYHRFAERPLTELAMAKHLLSANHLSGCLQAFCGRLADLRAAHPGLSGWPDLFLDEEMTIQPVAIGASGPMVSGRIDAVRTDAQHGLVVVDYKLSRGSQAKHDLVQLAIYTHLLERTKPGLAFAGMLEYYEPKLTVLDVTRDALRDLFQDMVRPVLEGLGSQPGEASQWPKPKMGAARPKADKPRPSEPDLGPRIEQTFAAFKLAVKVIGKVAAPQLIRYQIQPAPGVKVVSLANRAEDLQVSLSLPTPPRIEPSQGFVTIDVPRDDPDAVFWRDIRGDQALQSHPSRVAFPIGLGVDGKLVICDFADPNTCHGLVAGTSGSGKSEFLKALVASLIARNSSESLRITLIDPKILTFGELHDSRHLTGPIVTDLVDAIHWLEQAAEDMERRYRQLGDEGFQNLGQRIAAVGTDLPFHVMIFDEFADLVLAGKGEKKQFEDLVARLAAKGRAAGIHLVLATQRPDRAIVTGKIKANLPLRICLKVTSSINSQIILDEPGGEALVGRGDLLCDRGRGVERAQSPYLPPGELKDLVNE